MKSIFSLIICLFSVTAIAETWSSDGTLTSVLPKPTRNGVYFKHSGNENPDGCAKSGWLFLSKESPLFEEMYSLGLAAYMSNTNIKVLLDGCQPSYDYPIITELLAEK